MEGRLRATAGEVLKLLQSLGWVPVYQSESHIQLRHPDRTGKVTVPRHAGRTLKPWVLASILRQAGVTPEELRRRL